MTDDEVIQSVAVALRKKNRIIADREEKCREYYEESCRLRKEFEDEKKKNGVKKAKLRWKLIRAEAKLRSYKIRQLHNNFRAHQTISGLEKQNASLKKAIAPLIKFADTYSEAIKQNARSTSLIEKHGEHCSRIAEQAREALSGPNDQQEATVSTRLQTLSGPNDQQEATVSTRAGRALKRKNST